MIGTKYSRPLTNGMMATLIEIHEREISGKDLCGHEVRNIAGLYKRQLIDIKKCISKTGKHYMGFYVTEKGKRYLETILKKMIA